ncbi:hypothetical protein HY29_18205 [Hyphomonas beringensis]|uniref:SapC family protein n=1 Tax=Hyphomonas beringensis TaxID=1280946 RepID=A0A062U1U3_9PROT|nr:SapC family protein [Hyphomonas beringensis]KCZ52252.1 hypothetical protein HY29_18205 [Hyphomonas beringensis]
MTKDNQVEADPQAASLPAFYNSVTPLFSKAHEKYRFDGRKDYAFAADEAAVMLITDEFSSAQRDYPIVFSRDDQPMPVALTGLPGQHNQFVSAQGKWRPETYIPAYMRRYPFILAFARQGASELSLCFDPSSKSVCESDEGNLFVDGEPSSRTQRILEFCSAYELGIRKTRRYMETLVELDLLMDAQVDVRLPGKEPTVLRGFQTISGEKLKTLEDDKVLELVSSGALALIYAHLFSLKNLERLVRSSMVQEDKTKRSRPKTQAAA